MMPDALGLLRLRALHGEPGDVRAATPPFVADAVVLERPLARGGAAG